MSDTPSLPRERIAPRRAAARTCVGSVLQLSHPIVDLLRRGRFGRQLPRASAQRKSPSQTASFAPSVTRPAAPPPGPSRPRDCRCCPTLGRRPGRFPISLSRAARASNGLGVAPHAETADHAHSRHALNLAEGVPQGVVRRRVADRLQGVARHVRELFVTQQRGQRGNRFLGGNTGQLPAGRRLLLERCIRKRSSSASSWAMRRGRQQNPPKPSIFCGFSTWWNSKVGQHDCGQKQCVFLIWKTFHMDG